MTADDGARDAAQQVPDESPMSLTALVEAIDALHEAADMPRRAELCRAALDRVDRTHQPVVWGILQRELGSSLAAADAEEAVAAFRRALEVLTPEAAPVPRASTLMNMGNTLADQAGGVELYEEALALLPPQDVAVRSRVEHNLGLAWRDRRDGDRIANLERAAAALRRALVLREDGPAERWAVTAENLAGVLLRGGTGQEDPEYAIDLLDRALRELPGERWATRRARVRHNLVLALCRRGRPEDLERARIEGERALALRTRARSPVDWAATTAAVAGVCAAQDALPQAVRLYRAALEELREDRDGEEWAGVTFNLSLALARRGDTAEARRCVLAALRVLTAQEFPAEHRAALGKLGDLAVDAREWQRAADAYADALEAADALFEGAGTDLGRRREAAETWHLYARAGYSQLRLGRVEEAVRTLDRGRARLLARALGGTHVTASARRLQDLAPAGGAAVIPVVTSAGGAAVVVPAGREALTADDVLFLDELTDRAVVELLGGPPDAPLQAWLGGFMAARGARAGSAAQRTWEGEIDRGVQRLWELLMGPVHERLSALGLRAGAAVAVVPHSGLSLLPLAAARAPGGTRRAVVDDWTLHFVPNLASLTDPAGGLGPPSLFAVADPVGDLPHARVEGQLVAAAFGRAAVLVTGAGAAGSRLSEAGGCSHLHLATHGRHSWEDARGSALAMADGDLSAAGIAERLRLRSVRLAVLSACETGLTELGRTLDEFSGLPASLLAAGAGAVVSTLWTVDDATTALLMGEFYRRHLTGREHSAAALRGAQLWLRDLDRRATVEALEPTRSVAARLATSGDPADFRAWAAIENFAEAVATGKASDRPWTSPWYWAGFVHVGPPRLAGGEGPVSR